MFLAPSETMTLLGVSTAPWVLMASCILLCVHLAFIYLFLFIDHRYDVDSGMPLVTFSGHNDIVIAAAVSPNCRALLTASRDQMVPLLIYNACMILLYNLCNLYITNIYI